MPAIYTARQRRSTTRKPFLFFSQAALLNTSETAYLTYSLCSLIDIEAYQEAYDWLQPLLPVYGNDSQMRNWDAWLAYQANNSKKASCIYDELFDEGHRDDEDFSTYMTLLADEELRDQLDARFDACAAQGMTESLAIIKSQVLTQRGQHDAVNFFSIFSRILWFDAHSICCSIWQGDGRARGHQLDVWGRAD